MSYIDKYAFLFFTYLTYILHSIYMVSTYWTHSIISCGHLQPPGLFCPSMSLFMLEYPFPPCFVVVKQQVGVPSPWACQKPHFPHCWCRVNKVYLFLSYLHRNSWVLCPRAIQLPHCLFLLQKILYSVLKLKQYRLVLELH